MPLRGARALERIPLIPVGEDAPEVTPSTPRRAPAPTGALTRDGIFAFGILLVVALGLSVALASRSRPRVVLWDDATAYPLAPLAIAPHTTADVLRTALESSSAEDEDAPRSWLAAPPTVAVFAWEDGVFTLNAVRPPRRDEREEISDDDDVDARTNRERRDARAEDRALARWRAQDFAALLGEARSKNSDDASARSPRMKEYASAYAAFSALAYTAMAYAPHRFKPGNDPFHVVLNPLASPFAPGCVRSAPRGFLRRDPCPEAKRWKAPTLDFAASPTSRDVFPSLVNVPSADFVAAALRRSEDGSLAVDEASLRAAARGDEAVNAPSNASEASSTNDDGLDGALGWLTPWEARVSTVVWRGFAADAYAPRAPFGADPMGASRCATLLSRRANANEASDEGTEFEASEPASEVGSNANASYSSGGGGSAASGSGGRGARASAATAAEWAARALADDGPAGRTTPGWRAVMLSVVARRGGEGGEGGDGEWIDARFLEEESEEESNKAEEEKEAETAAEESASSETAAEESASEESASEETTSSSSRKPSSSDTERDASSELSCASALPAYFSSAPPLSASERQRHKYALDVGDATVGSRSALETLRALASGALLFRVSSPLSDAFALAELEPWTHYVPVKPDLSDLRDLVDWARRDEDAARTVAARGAAWARAFGAEKAWARYFSLPLGRVAKAYAYEPDLKKQLEDTLVPLFAYDAAASGDESGHTGVFLEEAGGVLEEEEPRGGAEPRTRARKGRRKKKKKRPMRSGGE